MSLLLRTRVRCQLAQVPWADEIIATALRGGPVGYAALQYACAVAKVPMRAVRARCGQR